MKKFGAENGLTRILSALCFTPFLLFICLFSFSRFSFSIFFFLLAFTRLLHLVSPFLPAHDNLLQLPFLIHSLNQSFPPQSSSCPRRSFPVVSRLCPPFHSPSSPAVSSFSPTLGSWPCLCSFGAKLKHSPSPSASPIYCLSRPTSRPVREKGSLIVRMSIFCITYSYLFASIHM